MTVWQADFYRRPLRDAAGNPVWELVLCSSEQNFKTHAFCSQPDANAQWLTEQLKAIAHQVNDWPSEIHVFRPQSLSLLTAACQELEVDVVPTRQTPDLKAYLKERATYYSQLEHYTGAAYDPIHVERPAPLPLPDTLWGERWRFAAIAAGDLEPFWRDRPVPFRVMPEQLLPMNQNLPSSIPIPGVVIDGGRLSMRLAQWLQTTRPVALHAIPGEPDGLILEAGLVDRWIIATFEDSQVRQAAQTFRSRQQQANGLHFLLVQPDDSGMTYTGFWLLKREDEPQINQHSVNQ